MIEFFRSVLLVIGAGVVALIVSCLIVYIIEAIKIKIKDIKDSKRTIEKGTVMFIDGERVVIQRDLNVRFKKVKVVKCECDEIKTLGIEGYCFNTGFSEYKDVAQSDFEHKLLDLYLKDKQYMSRIVK